MLFHVQLPQKILNGNYCTGQNDGDNESCQRHKILVQEKKRSCRYCIFVVLELRQFNLSPQLYLAYVDKKKHFSNRYHRGTNACIICTIYSFGKTLLFFFVYRLFTFRKYIFIVILRHFDLTFFDMFDATAKQNFVKFFWARQYK